ncbi:MAG TPA: serine hydrolase domain-containing protein [Anaerolineales bacterium]|nr:serine hydrolase domain-containing protein [Anaerolineales bacterium]
MLNANFKIRLARMINKRVRENQFCGAILIRQGKDDLLRRGYGFANRTWHIRNNSETRFRIASVGKMFTAAAAMQLIEAGKFSLDTRVVKYLKLKGTKLPPEATVYHMLTMTSGIADWINENAEDFDAEWEQFCRDHPLYLLRRDADYLTIFSQLKPYNAVGEKHRYNNAGFMLLGLMIEKAAGTSYFDYIRQNIFARAGMTQSDFIDLDDVSPNVAEGYVPIRDENGTVIHWRKNIYSTTAGGAADGGSTSTLDDLVRFSRALRSGKLCSKGSAESMLTPKIIMDEEEQQWRYGFGCFILLDDEEQIVRWGHTGEEDGVSCRLFYYPQHKLDVVILGNQTSCAGAMSRDIHELIMETR